MKNYIKIFSIFALGLMWINYPQTAYSLGVAPSFQSSELSNTSEMKKCNKCEVLKPLDEFSKSKSNSDGLAYSCKVCNNKFNTDYSRTKDGVVTTIYATQKHKSKLRGHNPPSYTKQELKDWLFSQQLFHELFNVWRVNNYDSYLKPSVDRKDDYDSYLLSNIQLMTWGENNTKAREQQKRGESTPGETCKAVIGTHKTNGKIIEFHSLREAQRQTGIAYTHISDCCWGKSKKDNKGYYSIPKTAGGYKWKFKNN